MAAAPAATTVLENAKVRDATGKEDGLASYEVERAIGRGHFSTVHKAVHKPSGRAVAMKKIQIFESMDAKSRERCLKEVELLQSLAPHPCIIAYIDAFLDSNELYIIFEWAAHGDLRRLIKKAHEAKVHFEEAHIWRYFVQVCDAIRHMHSHRIMHRDIKPANIFLSSDGAVKLGDLGLGRAFSSQTFEALSKVGTPLYMSPEVLDGRGYEWRSDVWSLGVLLYELAALRSPFKAEGDNLYMLFQKISRGAYAPVPAHFSAGLAGLVGSILRVDPTERPSIDEVLESARTAAQAFAQPPAAGPGPAPAGSGGGGSGGAEIAYLVMDACLEKLKLLDYERLWLRDVRGGEGRRPLERTHFAHRTEPREQFITFCRLVHWLSAEVCALQSELLQLLPASATDPAFERAALAAAATVVSQLELMCAKAGHAEAASAVLESLAPAKLALGHGVSVCMALNLAVDCAMLQSGFEWRAPLFGADGADALPDAPPDDEAAGADGTLPAADWAEDEEDGRADASGAGGAERGAGLAAQHAAAAAAAPPVFSELSAEAWQGELERLAPQLRLVVDARAAARGADVRAVAEARRRRLDGVRAEAAPWAELLGGVQRAAPPAALAVCERAAEVRPLMSGAHALEAEHARQAARVDEATRALQARVAQLEALDEELARTRAALEEKGAQLGGDQAVSAIRRATRELRAESSRLGTQVATLQAELSRRALADSVRGGRAPVRESLAGAMRPRPRQSGKLLAAGNEADPADDAARAASAGSRASEERRPNGSSGRWP